MILMIIAGLLIAGIAFYQAGQGLFSAMIMAVLTVLCAAAAFNYYEPLADLLAANQGAYAHAVALLAVFVLPLLALRIVIDRLIPGNVLLNEWADRIGGGAFGLVTGLVLTGMLMIVLQLLPVPGTILMYQPYDENFAVKDAGPVKWACDFTLDLAGRLSGGSLEATGAGRRFDLVHGDLMQDCFALRNRPEGAGVRTGPDATVVLEAMFIEPPKGLPKDFKPEEVQRESVFSQTPINPMIERLGKEGTRVLVVRVSVDQSARDETNNWFVLPASHFRLTTQTPDGQPSPANYYPVAYLTYAGTWRINTATDGDSKADGKPDAKASGKAGRARIADIRVERPWSETGPEKLIVDWVYRIPAAEKPVSVIFRRVCESPLPQPVVPGNLPVNKEKRWALGVKPVENTVKFAAAGGSVLFQPDRIEAGDRLPDGVMVPQNKEGRNIIKSLQVESDRVKSVVLDGALAELKGGEGTKYCHSYFVPKDMVMMQAHLTIPDKSVRLDGDTEQKLQNMKPVALMNDGSEKACFGAWVTYDGKSRCSMFYNDAGQDREKRTREMWDVLSRNFAKVDAFGVVFLLPADAASSIVGLRFGAPGYEFLSPSPLACKRQ